MKIIVSAHHVLLIIIFFLIFINVRAQIPVAPIKFQQVDEKRFYEIKDSLYAKPGDGFRYDNDVYLTLTVSDLYEIINSLKNGFIPYLDRKPYIQTTEILFGSASDILGFNQTIVNISDVFDDLHFPGVITVRVLAGNLKADPRLENEIIEMLRQDSIENKEKMEREQKMQFEESIKMGPPCSFYWLKDTIFPNSVFLRYLKASSEIKIEWGNETYHRQLPDRYSCSGSWTSIPAFDWANNDFIGLRIGCGTGCWGSYILPLNKVDSVQFILSPLLVDSKSNTLVYIDSLDKYLLIIQNLKTGKRQIVDLNLACMMNELGVCIDRVILKDEELIVKYDKTLNLPDLIVEIGK